MYAYAIYASSGGTVNHIAADELFTPSPFCVNRRRRHKLFLVTQRIYTYRPIPFAQHKQIPT